MLIMSQEKTSLYNLSQMTDIYIYNENNEYFIKIGDFRNANYEMMGVYKTIDRAKEILEEIVKKYSDWENLKAGQPEGSLYPVYYMPKE